MSGYELRGQPRCRVEKRVDRWREPFNLASFHRARVWVMSYVFVGKQCRSEHRCLLKCEDDLIDLLAITDEP
ncbi:hypothetical protein E3N86_16045 [Cryobacterium sp. Hz7]|nr:hypothetical protein E3N86_16045 [Cryobacterium sp. Hz7]